MPIRIELSAPIALADRLGPAFTRAVASDFIATGLLGPVYATGRGDLVASSEVSNLAVARPVDFSALDSDPTTHRGLFVVRCGPRALRNDGSVMGVDTSDPWPDRVQATAGVWHIGPETRARMRDIINEQGFVPMVVLVKSWPAWGFEITNVPSQRGAIHLPVQPPGPWYDQHIAGRWMALGRGATSLFTVPSENR